MKLYRSSEAPLNSNVMPTKDKSRLIAAVLYLIATFFFFAIICIFTSVGGETSLATWVTTGSPGRATIIYLLVSTGFSVLMALLLFSRLQLSKQHRFYLLSIALLQSVMGIIFASVSIVVTVLPLWFLFKFYRVGA